MDPACKVKLLRAELLAACLRPRYGLGMYSFLAFIITFAQLALLGASYIVPWRELFITIAVHGSPFYLVMNLLNKNSAFLDKNPIYMVILAYHVLKYFLILRAQLGDRRSPILYLAIAMEAVYLTVSGYYIN